ncbi:protein AMBP-like [Stegostoma tigrinum]|uniref:protein AMBP-like n=1 Tax=Stegostoma tigrinum TaxID=3053191 RepID=UPI00202B211E|nr:protein AMBP-like [Stegostoma tigrinum]
MRSRVVLLFAVLFLGTGAAVPLRETNHSRVQENFDFNQTLGQWFSIGSAGDSLWFETLMGTSRMIKFILSATEETNKFKAILVHEWNGTCINMTVYYEYLESQQMFKYIPVPGYDAHIAIQVGLIQYQEFAFLIYDSQIQGRKTKSVALYGRTRKLRTEINEQFKEFVLRQGIPEEMIMFLPDKGSCSGNDDIWSTGRR